MNAIKKTASVGVFLVLALMVASVAKAHFIWIGTEKGEVRVYFGESTTPDKAMFLGGIKHMKVWQPNGTEFKAVPFSLKKAEDGTNGWFHLNCKTGQPVIADCVYGFFGRGDKPSLLHYTAKYATIDNLKAAKLSGKLILEVVPTLEDNKVVLTVYFNGKPYKDATVRMESSSNVETLTSNENGKVVLKKGFNKRVWIRANMSVEENGEVDGKKYAKKAYYSTLVLDPKGLSTSSAVVESKKKDELKALESHFSEMPVGVTSFGAAVCNDRVFFFGGHCGQPHQYSKDGQNTTLYSHSLNSKDEWKEEGESGGLQGLAMVSHGGKIYRLGGFRADNESEEKADLHSVDEFAVFVPETKKWKLLSPLPEPRSSFDACVMGDKVFVVGGWAMAGPGKKEWRNTAYSFDFSQPKAGWKKLATPPFTRRALSVAFQDGKIVCVGGMQQKGGPTKKTAIYDPKSDKWSEGPALPGKGRMEGFGTSSFHAAGQVFVSTYGGGIYRLAKDFSKWDKVSELEDARFFHRLLSDGKNRIFIMGGSHMESGKVDPIELFQVK